MIRTKIEEHNHITKHEAKTWYIQSDKDSINQCYSVTIIHDGTYLISGDYSTLAIRCECHPDDWLDHMIRRAAGFREGQIRYFAEKVCQEPCGNFQQIETWDAELAEKELIEHLKEYYPDKDIDDVLKRVTISDSGRPQYDMIQMIDSLDHFDPSGDWTDGGVFGMRYTDQFKWQFECFRHWAQIAFKELIEEHTRIANQPNP